MQGKRGTGGAHPVGERLLRQREQQRAVRHALQHQAVLPGGAVRHQAAIQQRLTQRQRRSPKRHRLSAAQPAQRLHAQRRGALAPAAAAQREALVVEVWVHHAAPHARLGERGPQREANVGV